MVESKRFPLGKDKDDKDIPSRILAALSEIKEEIKELRLSLRPEDRFSWYQTGETNIAAIATEKNYAAYDKHNFLNILGRPARSGSVVCLSGGNIFVAVAETPTRITEKEHKLAIGDSFSWTPDDGVQVLRIYIRADAVNTKYELTAV